MKKNIFSALLVLTVYAAGITPGHAIFCSNCSQWSQQLLDYFRQGLQYAKEVSTDFSSGITATQQTLETVNNRILIPMRDAMTIITIMKSGDAIQNLILGSMGTDPLMVKNPESYFKNKALSSIGVDMSILSRQNSFYGNSVLSSLISSTRYNYADVSTKLAAINKSSIPKMIQSKVCNDASLSQLAQEDIFNGSDDGTIDPDALGDRKRELNRALCNGDPDTNPALAATLQKISEQRPDIGGWDAWLALTGGDNAYNKTVQSQQVINQKAQEVIDRAKADLAMGGGIKSLTECKKYAENDLNGNLYGESSTPGCALEEVRRTSSVLNSLYMEALNAPTKLLQNTLGPGAGNLVNTAFTSINLIQGITSAMDSLSGDSSGGPTNIPGLVVSSPTPIKDLTNNPKAKESLTTPPKQQLLTHQQSLGTLERVDQNYIADIGFYQNRLGVMKGCYDKLVSDHPQTQGDQRVTSAYSYYQSKTGSNTTLQTKITEEIRLIGTTKTLVANTIDKINSSQSSEEILTTFNSYQNQVDSQNLPNIMTGATREGEHATFKGEIDQASLEGGALFTYNADCTAIRQQLETMNFTGAGS
jgi:hypothetical protein